MNESLYSRLMALADSLGQGLMTEAECANQLMDLALSVPQDNIIGDIPELSDVF